MTQPKLGPVTIIDWRDSCSAHGGIWKMTKDVQKMTPSSCRSIGWLVSESKTAVVLASHYAELQMSGDMCIPKSAIIRCATLASRKRK